jgi:hypothetical protein
MNEMIDYLLAIALVIAFPIIATILLIVLNTDKRTKMKVTLVENIIDTRIVGTKEYHCSKCGQLMPLIRRKIMYYDRESGNPTYEDIYSCSSKHHDIIEKETFVCRADEDRFWKAQCDYMDCFG